ncbi:immunoglobulin superfamily member 10-like isoform X2 [Mercenaria mercenaria]|uniref:immunoglobulin superfamily member 10-like isoform X2 n=1 Tax=Mercenaria mercenaria TaxID=6596 RepID=UPI00234ECAC5|nr:immunoglobulin superfamily member 10-like isoform X2 [Mercenaria mercenaria]
MGLKQLTSHCIQIVMFVFCMKMVDGAYRVINMTKSCVLNHECKLPCRMEPFSYTISVLWFNDNNEMLTRGNQVHKHHRNLRIEKPAYNEWVLYILRVNRKFADKYRCKTSDGYTLSEITVVIEPIEGIKGHTLIIRDIGRYASDNYTCIATNEHGTAEREIKLTVDFYPEVTVMESEMSVTGGEMVIMGCAVQASPLQDAFWTNNEGDRVTSNWKYKLTEEKETDHFPVRFLELVIKSNIFSKQDEGNYTCHGVGQNSESKDVVILKVKDVG